MANVWDELGNDPYYPSIKKDYLGHVWQPRCTLCGEVGHQAIGCHYQPSSLDDKGLHVTTQQTSDFSEEWWRHGVERPKARNKKERIITINGQNQKETKN